MRLHVLINNVMRVTHATTLTELAEDMELPPVGVEVAINGVSVPSSQWWAVTLSEGDSITVRKSGM